MLLRYQCQQVGEYERALREVMQEIAVSDWMTLADGEAVSKDQKDASETAETFAEDATVASGDAEKTTAAVLALGAFGLRRRRDEEQK